MRDRATRAATVVRGVNCYKARIKYRHHMSALTYEDDVYIPAIENIRHKGVDELKQYIPIADIELISVKIGEEKMEHRFLLPLDEFIKASVSYRANKERTGYHGKHNKSED